MKYALDLNAVSGGKIAKSEGEALFNEVSEVYSLGCVRISLRC